MAQKDKKMEPVFKARRKGVDVAVFVREEEGEDGKYNNYSASVRKSYFDKKKDEWVTTNTFFQEDLDALSLVVDMARQFILRHSGNVTEENSDD